IDRIPEALHKLGHTFNGMMIEGNGFDLDVLKKAGAESADALVVVTNGDNTNIMTYQVAKKIFKIPRVITRLYDPRRAEVFKRLGLEVISGTTLFASMIRDKLVERRFTGFFIETRGMGIIELTVPGKFDGKPVADLNIPNEFLIATVIKKDNPIIPSPATRLSTGDMLIGIVRNDSVEGIKSMFETEE
ncbi:MAG: TrkA family potassium uptake protein, partial [Candidatus Aureabacteria bacterium]|nr:TrkA family potassium uptake protein [Candidatus Auribacterota bacterium]